jgi:hypothetical protein
MLRSIQMTEPDPDDEQLRAALNQSEPDLLRLIGRDVAKTKSYATPPSPAELERLGTNWLNRNLKQLQDSICRNAHVHRIACNPSDDFAIAVGILDIILALKLSVSPLTVTVLVVKRGLGTICGQEWYTKGPWSN